MMRILVVTEQYWPEGGGIELATHLIIKLLSQIDDMEFVVVTGTEKPKNEDWEEYLYVPTLDCTNKYALWFHLFRIRNRKWFEKLIDSVDAVYVPRYCYPVIPSAKKKGVKTVVHLHDYQPISPGAAIFPNSDGRNLLEKIEDEIRSELIKYQSKSRAFLSGFTVPLNKLVQKWVGQADDIICVSRRQVEIIKKEAPGLADKIRVVYNPPPEISKRVEGPPEKNFLYTGGDDPLKGIHVLFGALSRACKNNNWECTLTKVHQKKWRRFFQELGSRSDCTFHVNGKVNYTELKKIRSNSAALIFPSIWEEPLPFAIMEAMLSGTIPIASRVGGVSEMVEGTYGEELLFEPGNANRLSRKMERVNDLSPDELREIGSSLREKGTSKFEREKIKQKFVNTFKS
ncbi:hypothetical protein AKJ64_04795 [candidate division MSBL1 archaeon SCGC-AAA259E17]|uniref:Glycosyltransferase subfamily 4-like N-terminal domain-containing protein n=1 Tax=candidate division MSBL1 archaeon SCGC-AAA259E17 TaxID=1698263 RepID=A0A133UAX6_9EURY|nr:hypothetical protein AKJ64_04795 [candidate division MSBL1 archaeon SCGC-AAA259E17]